MCKGDDAEDVEITPDMIRAGVIALEEFSGSYGSDQLVLAVYRAMASLTPLEGENATS